MEYKNLNALPRLLKKLPSSLINPLVNHINQVLDIFYNYQSFSKFKRKNIEFYLNNFQISPETIRQKLEQEPFILVDRACRNKRLSVNQISKLPLNECPESQKRLHKENYKGQHQLRKLAYPSAKKRQSVQQPKKMDNHLISQDLEISRKSPNLLTLNTHQINSIDIKDIQKEKLIITEKNEQLMKTSKTNSGQDTQNLRADQIIFEESNFPPLEESKLIIESGPQKIDSETCTAQSIIKEEAIQPQIITKSGEEKLVQNQEKSQNQVQQKKRFYERRLAYKALSKVVASLIAKREPNPQLSQEPPLQYTSILDQFEDDNQLKEVDKSQEKIPVVLDQFKDNNQLKEVDKSQQKNPVITDETLIKKDNQSLTINTGQDQSSINKQHLTNQLPDHFKKELEKTKQKETPITTQIPITTTTIETHKGVKAINDHVEDFKQSKETNQKKTPIITQIPKTTPSTETHKEIKTIKDRVEDLKQLNNDDQNKPLISIVPKNGIYTPLFLKQQKAFEALCIPRQEPKDIKIEAEFNSTVDKIFRMIIQIGRITFLYPGNMKQEMDTRMTEQLALAAKTKKKTAHKLENQYHAKWKELIAGGLDQTKLQEAGKRQILLKKYFEAEHQTYSNIPNSVEIDTSEMTSFHIKTMYREYLNGKLPDEVKPVPIRTKDKQSKIILSNLAKVLKSYMDLVVNKFLRNEYFKDQEIRLPVMQRFKEKYSIINFNIIQKYNSLEIISEECIGKETQIYEQYLSLAETMDFMLEYTQDKIPLEILQQWIIEERDQ
ncbi:hypothetical protein ABPG72_019992 [Tetrahymena utriculariae]